MISGDGLRIMVAGGAGFIGSYFVRSLLSEKYPACAGAEVTVLDKLTYAGTETNLAAVADKTRYNFVRGDICDGELLAKTVPGHEIVINFAAESHVDRSITTATEFVDTNISGTQRLLQAALDAGVSKFIQVSTDEVYGSIETGSWTEDSSLLPTSPYAAAKASGDLIALAYYKTHGLPVCITRCSNNYGPHQFPEKIISRFVTHLIDGHRVPLYGDGENVRSWLHVDDHCRGIQLVVERGHAGKVYNIGGVALTNRQLTEYLLTACGAGWDMVEQVPDRRGHDRRYSVDDSEIRKLGYAPHVPFDEGIYETVRWYVKNPSWWRPLKSN